MKKTNKKGFTIVELVIVIAVIAILAAVLIPNLSRLVEKANVSKAMQEAKAAMDNDLVEANGDYTKMAAITAEDGKQLYQVSLAKDASAAGYYLESTTGDTTTYTKQESSATVAEGSVYYAAFNGTVELNSENTAAVTYKYTANGYTSTFTIATGTWKTEKSAS